MTDETRTTQSYTDPSRVSIQLRTGITQRAIINTCKRNEWPWCKIAGRIWVCADFVERYEANVARLKERGK